MSGPMPVRSQQEDPERDVHPVEERRAHRDLVTPAPLGDDREERAPQHRERDADQRRLLKRKAASRDSDSSRASGSSRGQRVYSSVNERIAGPDQEARKK
jgi:hypothetical protein